MKRLPIGISDFKEIITEECYLIDKTLMIKDVVEGAKVILYPRPRRFGKTLNLSMLRYFYDNSSDNRFIFRGLNIEKEEKIMEKQGKYPVIYITFKDVKEPTYERCIGKVKGLISSLYSEYRFLLKTEILGFEQKIKYEKILMETGELIDYENSIKNLAEFLAKYHGVNPVILIDEYDMPLQVANVYGYYDDMVLFIRNLLSGCLKDNIYLEKAVLTGILRVAKESIFSGLNNFKVLSLLANKSGDKFGFLEEEVAQMMEDYDEEDKIEKVKQWYNGYNFGEHTIYNPWSILNYTDEKTLRPYWSCWFFGKNTEKSCDCQVNTSGNEMIKDLLGKADDLVKQDLNELIEGKSIKKRVEDNIVYGDIDSEDVLWSFLLMSGYLRYDNLRKEGDFYYADLRIPNEEVMYLFRSEVVTKWFQGKNTKYSLERVLNSLTNGDLKEFRKLFIEFSISSFSYFDVSSDESEKFYHAFVLGMVVALRDEYEIRSNRESGYGRYDVMLIPHNKNKRAIIFEFKKVDQYEKETMETAMENAKTQIMEKDYEAELRSQKIENIAKIAAVFEGKKMDVEIF